MAKTSIEIKDAYIVANRLTVIAIINGKDEFNVNYPAELAEDKEALLEKILKDYTEIGHNIKITAKNKQTDLVGVNKL